MPRAGILVGIRESRRIGKIVLPHWSVRASTLPLDLLLEYGSSKKKKIKGNKFRSYRVGASILPFFLPDLSDHHCAPSYCDD